MCRKWLSRALLLGTSASCNALSGIDDLYVVRSEEMADAGADTSDDGSGAVPADACTGDCKPPPAGCEHDCDSGETRCQNNTQQTCNNYDADECREWGDALDCGSLGCAERACRRCEIAPDDECAIVPVNCGCPGGAVCQIDPSHGNNRCMPGGSAAAFERCESSTDCQVGNSCHSGVCRPHCADNLPCAPGAGSCQPVAELPGIGLCTGHCDPIEPTRKEPNVLSGCGLGVYCAPGQSDGTGVTGIARCTRAAGLQGRYAECETTDDCAAGLACNVREGQGRCTPWCRTGSGTDTGCGSDAYFCEELIQGYQMAPGAPVFGCSERPCERPPGATCSVLPTNCGCPAGEACQIDLGTGAAYCENEGAVSSYGLCGSNADCTAGNVCVPLLGYPGVCYPYCSSVRPCPTNQGECAELNLPREDGDAGGAGRVENVNVCTGHCDPVYPTRTDATFQGCGAGVYCSPPATNQQFPYAMCVGAEGPASVGQSCSGTATSPGCAAGLQCEAGACAPWCRSDADCPEEFSRCVGAGFTAGHDDPISYCVE